MHFLRKAIFLFLVCWLTVASHGPPAVAQDASGSSIRLASSAEPVRDNAVAESAPQEGAQFVDDAPPTLTASQPVQTEDQSTALAAQANEPTTVERPPARRPRMPAGFYPSASSRETLAQMPRRAPIQSATQMQQSRRTGKPFSSIPTQPTISPYLYLNAGSGNASPISNYLTLVRPHADQLEATRHQQQEIEELRTQVQQLSAAGAGPQQSATRNSAARYMNTAQFYRGMQR